MIFHNIHKIWFCSHGPFLGDVSNFLLMLLIFHKNHICKSITPVGLWIFCWCLSWLFLLLNKPSQNSHLNFFFTMVLPAMKTMPMQKWMFLFFLGWYSILADEFSEGAIPIYRTLLGDWRKFELFPYT